MGEIVDWRRQHGSNKKGARRGGAAHPRFSLGTGQADKNAAADPSRLADMMNNVQDIQAFSQAFQAPTALYRTLEHRPALFLPRTLSYRQSRLKRRRHTRRRRGIKGGPAAGISTRDRFLSFEILGCGSLPAGAVLCAILLEEVRLKGSVLYWPTSVANVSSCSIMV